jgi:hypothetical protein
MTNGAGMELLKIRCGQAGFSQNAVLGYGLAWIPSQKVVTIASMV